MIHRLAACFRQSFQVHHNPLPDPIPLKIQFPPSFFGITHWLAVFMLGGGVACAGQLSAQAADAGQAAAVAGAVQGFDWTRLPNLPDARGVAGPFAGVSGGALIAAGGANFPNGFPWEGGTKVWHDDVYVLPIQLDRGRRPANCRARWAMESPRPRRVGLSVPEAMMQNGTPPRSSCSAGKAARSRPRSCRACPGLAPTPAAPCSARRSIWPAARRVLGLPTRSEPSGHSIWPRLRRNGSNCPRGRGRPGRWR